MARMPLLDELDRGDAAVTVAPDELHEAFARREPGGPGAAPELEAGLRQRRPDDERRERPSLHLHRLRPDDLRISVDTEHLKVAAGRLGAPGRPGPRIGREDR